MLKILKRLNPRKLLNRGENKQGNTSEAYYFISTTVYFQLIRN